MNPMGPTLTLSGPWAKPSYKNPGTVGRCKISPSGIILNGLTLNLSALNDQALPDKRGPLPRLQGTVPHSPLTWIPGIKTICKHFETVHIYVNILILQNKIPTIEINCRQFGFHQRECIPDHYPLSDKVADSVTMTTHSDEFSNCPNIPWF